MSNKSNTSATVLGPINFYILVGALSILKPIFSIILAVYLGWVGVVFLSDTFYFQQDPSLLICKIPIVSYIPLCQSPIPDFSKLVNRQVETYEQIMDQQLSYNGPSSSLALDIKKAELATADLRTLIKYSSLTTSNELVDRLTEFVDKARIVGRSLQLLQARTRSSLDNLITYNLFALKALENVRDNKASSKELSVAYNQMMSLIESDLKRMILVGQDALGSLTDLDEMLMSIHDLATQESTYQKTEHNKLLADLWSRLGFNVVKRQIFQDNLELLIDLDRQRRLAVSQVQTTLYSLTSYQLDMEELREHVSRPSIIEMPVELHIENVGKGIERLRHSKVALKSDDDTRHFKLISQSKNEDNTIKQ
ncbi:1061_t:CDS:2 [Funneliformis mosseae]|uniref:1061_t:CDS:1 n=1 Tax=Funneliformis mosseae TaxID=27381 RepID=A0A9N9A0N9_FUNMO|nr:1061_t:CDS:2 [Funneliformis mosseae]